MLLNNLASTISTGINRNIVECKLLFGLFSVAAAIELIETLWNVNKNTMELKEIESMN